MGFHIGLTDHQRRVTLWPLACLLIGAITLGCGADTNGRVPLAGQVFLNGQPLDRGSIEFHPQDAAGMLTGGVIKDGVFEIPATQGATPGKYQVRVFAAGTGVEIDPSQPPGPESARQVAVERIPARFNLKSELEVEIAPQGNKDLRFDLETS
jgi:hypothetical protein